ncbi:MAG: hypothetical protein JSW03_04865 [Candidatus Eiseniibacteriota bacterium]|nr:MAG: hypothetical protein JSW03_04865 [Candidatus Eisenbacteria bacterium]
MKRLLRYFDLASGTTAAPGKRRVPRAGGLFQYVALFMGVWIQPFFAQYQATGQWSMAISWGWVLFAAIVCVPIFPAVYRKSFDPEKPGIIQLCSIFTVGLGWESMLGSVLKAI